MVDATLGVTQEDADMAAFLHRQHVPVLLVSNKADSPRQEAMAWEFVNLGFGNPWPLSALHGRGTADVLDEVVKQIYNPETTSDTAAPSDSAISTPATSDTAHTDAAISDTSHTDPAISNTSVSYTHLTLPTIYSV